MINFWQRYGADLGIFIILEIMGWSVAVCASLKI